MRVGKKGIVPFWGKFQTDLELNTPPSWPLSFKKEQPWWYLRIHDTVEVTCEETSVINVE